MPQLESISSEIVLAISVIRFPLSTQNDSRESRAQFIAVAFERSSKGQADRPNQWFDILAMQNRSGPMHGSEKVIIGSQHPLGLRSLQTVFVCAQSNLKHERDVILWRLGVHPVGFVR
jgi:hypothetical protein